MRSMQASSPFSGMHSSRAFLVFGHEQQIFFPENLPSCAPPEVAGAGVLLPCPMTNGGGAFGGDEA
eukprot:CAMPEP_0182573376 /NCGR_PEP_ID=MMETSP1324-20130603/19827_1 /TAXON_ID=236786 /ORGANISM="Florenciella sp., Strain RCC1587" /LENGTH=65 /DNA_ID=CAMNT_0024788477 /DNA_START=149 /DNA_END=342 /DNA_ORIENTATION=-